MACYSPLKGYRDPISNGLVFYKTSTPLSVACGQCLGCRIDRTFVWAMRIVHEAHLHERNCFITLTYRNEEECTAEERRDGYYVPKDYSLNKTHFKLFIKRLRKKYKNEKIKYFHCGEYGDENLRPHYHACLFNCSFEDQQIYDNTEGRGLYSSATLEKLWRYGFSTVAELNFATASYTAGYILKKITGKKALDTYLRSDDYGEAFWVTAPYTTMSTGNKKGKHLGIGAKFYEKYKKDFFPSDESPIPGKGIYKKVPRYYQNILEGTEPGLLGLVKEKRAEFIRKHAADFTPERLKDKYNCACAAQQRKKRTL